MLILRVSQRGRRQLGCLLGTYTMKAGISFYHKDTGANNHFVILLLAQQCQVAHPPNGPLAPVLGPFIPSS